METENLTRTRVTIEGTSSSTLGGKALRLLTDEGSIIMVPLTDGGVSTETLTPARTWTDGDVVQHPAGGWTLTRQGGEWQSSHPRNPALWSDEQVSEHTDGKSGQADGWAGPLRVLRYQHGEVDGQHWLDAYADRVHNHGTETGPGLSCPERDVPGRAKPVGACLDRDPDVVTWNDVMRNVRRAVGVK